jgi:hypothetical protein
MLAITADLLEGLGAKRIKKHSEPRAGSRRGYRKYRTSRFHLPYAAKADDRRVRAVTISA